MIRRFAPWALAVGLFGASCASSPKDAPLRPPGSSETSAAPVATASSAPLSVPKYDVHEWGLVREDQNATYRIGGAPPPREQEIIIVTKPVLYFRADAPLTLKSVDVSIRGGHVVETWPLAKRAADKDTYQWLDVSVDPTSPCSSSRLPRKIDPPCSGLEPDDPCESASLAVVRTVDSSCVRVGGATETFLFYRGNTAALTPPLRFSMADGGTVSVANDGDLPIPGKLIRIETVGRATRTLSIAPPAPHASIIVGNEFPKEKSESPFAPSEESIRGRGAPAPQTVTGPAREDIRTSMREVGMADTEIDAFVKAWDEILFGPVIRRGFVANETQTMFLYYLPETSIASFAHVAFDPPPRTFRRAFAVLTRIALAH